MIYLIYGPEDYIRKYEIAKISEQAFVTFREGYESGCLEALETCSFFGKNVMHLKYGCLGKEEALLKYLSLHRIDFHDLILEADTVRTNTKLFQFLRKNGKVLECKKLDQFRLNGHFQKACNKLNVKMTKEACRELIIRSGYLESEHVTLYTMNIYLKQLAYAADEITQQTVRELIPEHSAEAARELLEYVVRGNRQCMMKQAVMIARKRKTFLDIYGWIFRNLRIVFKLSMLEGLPKNERLKRIGITSYQLKNIDSFSRLSRDQILQMMEILLQATRETKEGAGDECPRFFCTLIRLSEIAASRGGIV